MDKLTLKCQYGIEFDSIFSLGGNGKKLEWNKIDSYRRKGSLYLWNRDIRRGKNKKFHIALLIEKSIFRINQCKPMKGHQLKSWIFKLREIKNSHYLLDSWIQFKIQWGLSFTFFYHQEKIHRQILRIARSANQWCQWHMLASWEAYFNFQNKIHCTHE